MADGTPRTPDGVDACRPSLDLLPTTPSWVSKMDSFPIARPTKGASSGGYSIPFEALALRPGFAQRTESWPAASPTLISTYLVYNEDRRTVPGCSRLTPIEFGCMLRDHFAELIADPSLFDKPDIWEGTRFCVDSGLPAEKRAGVLNTIAVGYLKFALANGINQIIGLMPTGILYSVFACNGIALERLGGPRPVGEHSKIQTPPLPVTSSLLQSAQDRTGLSNVLKPLVAEADCNVA